jgi:hypothetical protein
MIRQLLHFCLPSIWVGKLFGWFWTYVGFFACPANMLDYEALANHAQPSPHHPYHPYNNPDFFVTQPVFGIQLAVDFRYRMTPVDIGGGNEELNVDYKFIIAAQNLFNILNGRVL